MHPLTAFRSKSFLGQQLGLQVAGHLSMMLTEAGTCIGTCPQIENKAYIGLKPASCITRQNCTSAACRLHLPLPFLDDQHVSAALLWLVSSVSCLLARLY